MLEGGMSAPSPAATFWGAWEKPLSGTGRSTAVPRRDTAPVWADFFQALHLEEPSFTTRAGICSIQGIY